MGNKKPKRNRVGVERHEFDVQYPFDPAMFVITIVLLIFGVIMMYSASFAWAANTQKNDGNYYFERQLIFALAGIVLMTFCTFIDYHHFLKPGILFTAFFIILILLVLCLVPSPLKATINGASRWIKLGPAGTFQPSEAAKIVLILLTSYLVTINYSKLGDFWTPVKVLTPFMMVAALLLAEPHFSAIIITGAICVAILVIGGIPKEMVVFVGIAFVVVVAGAMAYFSLTGKLSYIEVRINCWLHPFEDAYLKDTWQTRNSIIAIGSGGITGLGFGNSRQKFLYLPESQNDFVFAIVCEELGFVGALLVVVLFMLFGARGVYIARYAPDKSGMMIATGITLQLTLQAILNIAVVSGTIPNTGVSLPFFSYGGTALLVQLAEVGILLNISRHRILDKEEYEMIYKNGERPGLRSLFGNMLGSKSK